MGNFYNQIKNIVLKLPTINNIIILGKGDSLSKVNKEALKKSFIININDAERFYAGHIGIFYSNWAYESIRKNNFKNDLYLTSIDILEDCNWTKVEYKPETHEIGENSLSKINDNNFHLTNFLIIPAIKIANFISNILKRKIDVYMLGFDFHAKSSSDVEDFSRHGKDFKNIILKNQKEYFRKIKNELDSKNKSIKLHHVGLFNFSSITVDRFNSKFVDLSLIHI